MYEEKYVKRGEIYSIGGGEESEGLFSKPGLIISSDGCNENSSNVIVAYLTLKDSNIGIHYGPTKATGKPSYIQCEYLATVNKKRVGRFMGRLSENEMKEVESRLDEVLDLGYVDNTPLREKEAECEALLLQLEELRAENARLKQKDQQHEDELLTRDVEIAVHKRMYEKAVGIIAAMRSEGNLPKPPQYVKEIEAAKKLPEKKWAGERKPPKVESKLVDINTAAFGVLRSIGLSNGVVLAVINGRPYTKIEDLKKVPGVNSKLYSIVEKKICCNPVPEESPKVESKLVDINTAAFGVLRSIGLSNGVVLAVINGRPYTKIEDLKKVPGVNSKLYSIVEKKICCNPVPEESPKVEEPVVVEAEEPTVVEENVTKVNVNTATVEEMMNVGLSKLTAQEIRAWRNKNGNFEKLEDLLILKRFGAVCMKRYGHLLEV